MFAHIGEISVVSQAAVNPAEIAGVIAMRIVFKKRRKIDGICAQCLNMFGPIAYFANAADTYTIIDTRCIAESQRIDLIEYTFISPHNTELLYGKNGLTERLM